MNDSIHNSQFIIHNSQLQNPNIRFTWLFVAALAGAGLRHVVIAPGSRSTPLTLAFAARPEIETHLHVDERGSGFLALGMALALDAPVALVCTSGTAVANFLPAIVEARMSQVPLLLLTGDRPPELRHSGANQTIDQVKIFGGQVLWHVDMPLPQPDAPDVALRHVQATAVRAYATANGIRKGPVHVNFPFRKPLEPSVVSRESSVENDLRLTPYALRIEHGHLTPTANQLERLTAVLTHHRRGIIVCGPRCPAVGFPRAVTKLAQQLGWPIFADPLSGVRFYRRVATIGRAEESLVISGYETFLQKDPGWPEPEVMMRFGAVPTSKWLNHYLDGIRPQHRIHVRQNGVWADDSHRTTWFLQADAELVCTAVSNKLSSEFKTSDTWRQTIQATEAAHWQATESQLQQHWFDGAAIAALLDLLPEDSNLFIGNSLPVRHLDEYGRSRPKQVHVYGNRGASGIDGNIATGLGIAAASGRPTFIVVGDVTALHDLNSLLILTQRRRGAEEQAEGRLTPQVTLIVMNNNGGGVFRRLPVAQHEPPFTDLFLTPHGRHFEQAAAMFGLAYRRVEGRSEFEEAVKTAVTQPGPHLIELITDGQRDYQIRQEISQAVNQTFTNDN